MDIPTTHWVIYATGVVCLVSFMALGALMAFCQILDWWLKHRRNYWHVIYATWHIEEVKRWIEQNPRAKEFVDDDNYPWRKK